MTREENALIYFKDLRERKVEDYSLIFDTAPKDSVVYEAVSAEIEIYDIAIKALEQTTWIPVSERLPEDFQRVLVTIVNYKGNKVVRVAEYYSWKGVFQIKETHEEWKVGEKGLLAWMPLPKPYEPQESEEQTE